MMQERCMYVARTMVAWGAQQAAANKADMVVEDNIHQIKTRTHDGVS